MPINLSAQHLKEWLHDGHEIALFDVREPGPFGEGHLFYAVPLPYSQLERRVTVLAPNLSVRIVVYDDGEDHDSVAYLAQARLQALGYRNVHGLAGGTPAWRQAGFALFQGEYVPSKTFGELVEEVQGTPHLSADALAARQARGDKLVVLDGRPFREFQKMSIPGAVNCPNGELARRLDSLVPDRETLVVVNCAGRTRSIIGAQTLINLGVPNPVVALENGTQGWYLADHPLDRGQQRRHDLHTPVTPAQIAAARGLAHRAGAEWVSAEQVRAWAAEPDRSLFVFDVRLPEEFAAGTLPGARSAPGGQLQQATDGYVGVRHATLVLFDDDGVRAPVTASWLRQMGWQAYILEDGLHSGLELEASAVIEPPQLPTISADQLALVHGQPAARVIDLRSSHAYREGHISGSLWSIRPLLRHLDLKGVRQVILVTEDLATAGWAALDLRQQGLTDIYALAGGLDVARAQGLPVEATPNMPTDEQRIDFLAFTHDRHEGNKASARQYLAWELGLLGQIDSRELAAFRPLVHAPDILQR